jgi:hypothetical protein
MKYKYKIGQRVLLHDGRRGRITDLQESIVDSKSMPSYWIIYSKKIFSDGYARNTWETSIKRKLIFNIF